VMTRTVLDPHSVEGWRGEIEDSRVVKDHETALREERTREGPERGRAGGPEEEGGHRRPPQRRRSPEEEEYDAYDEGDDYDDAEYAERPEPEEPPRHRGSEQVRRSQPRDEPGE